MSDILIVDVAGNPWNLVTYSRHGFEDGQELSDAIDTGNYTPDRHGVILSNDNMAENEFLFCDSENGQHSYLSEEGTLAIFSENLFWRFATSAQGSVAMSGVNEPLDMSDDLSDASVEDIGKVLDESDPIDYSAGELILGDDAEDATQEAEEGWNEDIAEDNTSEESETMTLEDVADELKEEIRKTLPEMVAEEIAKATAQFDRRMDVAAIPFDEGMNNQVIKVIDYITEQFGQLVTARSIAKGNAYTASLSIMFESITKVVGNIDVPDVPARVVANPDLWEARHMTAIAKALTRTILGETITAKNNQQELEVLKGAFADLSSAHASIQEELRKERRASVRADVAPAPVDTTPTSELTRLHGVIDSLNKKLARYQAIKPLPKYALYCTEEGFACVNPKNSKQVWWEKNILKDPDSILMFNDAPGAVKAAPVFEAGAAKKNSSHQVYVVALTPVPAMADAVIKTGKFKDVATNTVNAPSLDIGDISEIDSLVLSDEENENGLDLGTDDDNGDIVQPNDFADIEPDGEALEFDTEESEPVAPVAIAHVNGRARGRATPPVSFKAPAPVAPKAIANPPIKPPARKLAPVALKPVAIAPARRR